MATRAVAPLRPRLTARTRFYPSIPSANFPCVCMNTQGTAVVFYQTSGKIWYIVGAIPRASSNNGEEQRAEWGEPRCVGDGCNVQAAINDSNEVVIVYSENWWRVCHYKAGVVQENDNTIQWWEQAAGKLARGVNPTVALKGRTILFVYEAGYGTYRAFYVIGEIKEYNIIENRPEQRLPALDGYKQISVAITTNGRVIFTSRSIIIHYLYYSLGKLVGTELQNVTAPKHYGDGYFNHVSLLDNNSVIAVHESWQGDKLMLKMGRLEADTVTWTEEQRFDPGYRISAAVNNYFQMVVVIVQNKMGYGEGMLMYKYGSIN